MTGHNIEATVMVYLRWNGAGWEIDPVTDLTVVGRPTPLDFREPGIVPHGCDEEEGHSDFECKKELHAAHTSDHPTARNLLHLLVRHFYPHDLPDDLTREEVEKWLIDNR